METREAASVTRFWIEETAERQERMNTLAIGGLLGAGVLNAAYFLVFVLV